MVGTVAGDGAPRSLSVFRSSGVCWTRRQGKDKKTTKEDKRTERQTEGGMGGSGGEGRAGTSPAGALAHLPCCHTNGDTIRVGLKDGGGKFFFWSGGRVVMEGQRRIKGAGSCQGKRDGSGKTGTNLNGRHLLGYAGVFFSFFFPVFAYSVGSSGRGVVEGRDAGEGEVVLLRTALNGRPRAGVNWGKNGVEDLGRERFST